VSLAAALGGWFVGWLVYGRAPAEARTHDPLQQLGPVWRVVHHKYYVDELYAATVVRLSLSAADVSARFDRNVVDAAVNLAGRLGKVASELSERLDRTVVDGAVNLTGIVTMESSRGLRRIQTGRVQQYLLVVFISVLFLVVAYVL